jgi:hypothetical protein
MPRSSIIIFTPCSEAEFLFSKRLQLAKSERCEYFFLHENNWHKGNILVRKERTVSIEGFHGGENSIEVRVVL